MADDSALQFDHAEFETSPGGMTCSSCNQPIAAVYYEANGKTLCERCRFAIAACISRRPGPAGFLRATLAGAAAALAGAIVYFVVLAVTGYIFGLVAILVGYLVGRAVRWGTGNRGGWPYQSLAIVLTYLAIVSAYIPMIVKGFAEMAAKDAAAHSAPATPGQQAADAKAPGASAADHADAASRPSTLSFVQVALALVFLLGVAAFAPFLNGFDPLGWAIIAFGLYQAWKMNRRVTCEVHGPFTPGATPAPSTERT